MARDLDSIKILKWASSGSATPIPTNSPTGISRQGGIPPSYSDSGSGGKVVPRGIINQILRELSAMAVEMNRGVVGEWNSGLTYYYPAMVLHQGDSPKAKIYVMKGSYIEDRMVWGDAALALGWDNGDNFWWRGAYISLNQPPDINPDIWEELSSPKLPRAELSDYPDGVNAETPASGAGKYISPETMADWLMGEYKDGKRAGGVAALQGHTHPGIALATYPVPDENDNTKLIRVKGIIETRNRS